MLDETKNFAKFIKNFPVHCTDAARKYISPPDSKNSLSNLVQDMRTYIEIQGLDKRNFDTLIAPGVEDIERKLNDIDEHIQAIKERVARHCRDWWEWTPKAFAEFTTEEIKSQILPLLEEMMVEWHRATTSQHNQQRRTK